MKLTTIKILLSLAGFLMIVQGCEITNDSQTNSSAEGSTQDVRDQLSRAEKMGKIYEQSLVTCPDRVWPGLGLDNLLVYAVHDPLQGAFRWDGTVPSRVKSVDYAKLNAVYKKRYYAFNSEDERNVVSVSLDQTAPLEENYIAVLGIHEAFHAYVQNDWEHRSGGGRGTLIPIKYQPRFYRYMMIQSLKAAVEGDNKGLGAVRYWYDRYREEYPEDGEKIASTDVYEGSAEFVGEYARSLGVLGCNAKDESVLGRMVDTVVAKKRAILEMETLEKENFRLDAAPESYTLGLLSGMLLTEKGKSDWKERVEGGEAPVDILMEGVKPQQQEESEEIRKIRSFFQDKADTRNETYLSQFREFSSKLEDGEKYFQVELNKLLLDGLFKASGSVKYQRQNFTLDYSASSTSGDVSIESTLVSEPFPGECGYYSGSLSFPVLRSEVELKEEEGKVVIKGTKVVVEDKPYKRVSRDGKSDILCVGM